MAFFSLSTDHLALSMFSLSRIQGHAAGVAAFALLALALRHMKTGSRSHWPYLLASCAVAGGMAAVHLPRTFAIGFIFAIVFPLVVVVSGRQRLKPLLVAGAAAVGVASVLLVVGVAPKIAAIMSIYSSHNTALPEYDGENIPRIIALDALLVIPPLVAAVAWLMLRFGRGISSARLRDTRWGRRDPLRSGSSWRPGFCLHSDAPGGRSTSCTRRYRCCPSGTIRKSRSSWTR